MQHVEQPRPSVIHIQAVNLRGFCALVNPTFEGGILDFMDGIPDFMENFNIF